MGHWFVRRAAPGRRLRLFCFPYAGGSAAAFQGWQAALDPAIEVCALQLPGRGSRFQERPADQMAPLLKQLAEAVGGHGDLPFAFFGHSLGALLAFELVHCLRASGQVLPVHLFVSGASAPARRATARMLHRLPDAAFVDELRRYNGTPPEALDNAELMELLLPTIRADFAMAETYAYVNRAPLPTPISVLAGTRDPLTSAAQLEGWQAEAAGRVRIERFPGDHFFIQTKRDMIFAFIQHSLNLA